MARGNCTASPAPVVSRTAEQGNHPVAVQSMDQAIRATILRYSPIMAGSQCAVSRFGLRPCCKGFYVDYHEPLAHERNASKPASKQR